ncbi:hypothetical protein BDV26DRAFT_54402 [Aspergillus bertholletiae]|uniref:Zn(2)-C6 fungal-type domain-containing protein n=1 Tax=Aspergillus bertholletiae TaxID=1226010 RepID=A0A5N7AYN7_9EURO|nr:hypothetical protein BDV26DRAFT_54402 [Aspergillus bertholletiae]
MRDSLPDDLVHGGKIKRIRQACSNCRRRKTKCSGERPICFHCNRNKHTCVYEPYWATASDNPPAAPVASTSTNNENLLERIVNIESRLAELSGRTTNAAGTSTSLGQYTWSPFTGESGTSPLPNPPQSALRAVIDTYFVHVHNQPYSYFQEASFRRRFDHNLLPRCLLLAVLASAVRFCTHEFYAGRSLKASEAYAREAWLAVLSDDLTVEENMSLHVVQAVNILVVVDYTAGRVNAGWLKIGLAARISQALGLMHEPDMSLSVVEQEERRRTFWSVYLLDRLISCGRSRPLVIQDLDCQVQLPCDEEAFRSEHRQPTQTLHHLLSWNTEVVKRPSPFALVILLASIFGKCTRYVYGNRDTSEIPPWDARSEYSAILSSLLLFESHAGIRNASVSEMLVGGNGPNGAIDQQDLGHQIFAHTLYHLCHCLLNHPFVLHQCLKPYGPKAPHSFTSRALQTGLEHATLLVDLLCEVSQAGALVQSSFYAYCIAVAGAINSVASHVDDLNVPGGAESMLRHFERSLDVLDGLASLWGHAVNMSVRLREFHLESHSLAGLFDPAGLCDELDRAAEDKFWSMLDYSILGSVVCGDSASKSDFPSLPSPLSWALESDILAGTPARVNGGSGEMFGSLVPAVRGNEGECLLNYSSPGTGLI